MKDIDITPEAWACFFAVILMLMDIISGLFKGCKLHSLNSETSKHGLYAKFSFILIMALGAVIDWAQLHMDLGFTVPVFMAVCVYVCLTEIISIVENAKTMNPTLENSRILSVFEPQGQPKHSAETIAEEGEDENAEK